MSSLSAPKILTNMGALLSGTLLARIISAVTLVLTARLLGPDTYGQYAASLSFVRIAAVLFTLGLDPWLLRSGGRARERLPAKSTASLSIQVVLGIAWLLLMALLAPYLNQSAFPTRLVLLCGASIWLEELGFTVASAFKAALRNGVTMWLLGGSQLLLLLLTLIPIVMGVRIVEVYLIVRVVAAGLSTLGATILLVHTFGLQFDRHEVRIALRETGPFGASVGLAALAQQADVTIVAQWLGQTAAGLYAPAVTIASALLLVPASIYGVMLPVLSQAYGEGVELVRQLSRQLLLATLLLAVGLAGVMLFAARPLVLFIYGPAYSLSGDVLRIFSGVLAFRCLSFALAAVLAAVGWQSKRVIVQAIVVVVNIALNVWVVERWGILGVAGVYVFTEAILMTGYLLWMLHWQRQSHYEAFPAAGR